MKSLLKRIEARDEVLTKAEAGDKKLEGLAGNLTIEGGDGCLLGTHPSMQGLVNGASVTAS